MDGEKAFIDKLITDFKEISNSIEIAGTATTLFQGIDWLNYHDEPDIIISVISLPDGL
jgi:hypothetical protein